MIKIEHLYCTHVYIIYYFDGDPYTFDQTIVGTMDEIAEMVSDVLVKGNFNSADVCSAETGEILMNITRS